MKSGTRYIWIIYLYVFLFVAVIALKHYNIVLITGYMLVGQFLLLINMWYETLAYKVTPPMADGEACMIFILSVIFSFVLFASITMTYSFLMGVL